MEQRSYEGVSLQTFPQLTRSEMDNGREWLGKMDGVVSSSILSPFKIISNTFSKGQIQKVCCSNILGLS